jgi:hypothetical protein
MKWAFRSMLLAGCILMGIGLGRVAARWVQEPAQAVTILPQSTLTVPAGDVLHPADQADPGLLRVQAKASIWGPPQYDRVAWWRIMIKQFHPDRTWTKVWEQAYPDQSYAIARGGSVDATFDDTFALPAGRYFVTVSLRERVNQEEDDGSINPTPIFLAQSYWARVP